MWVLGKELQLAGDGTLTNPESSSIIWIQELFDLEEGRRKDLWGPLPTVKLPLRSHALRQVVKALIDIVHDNSMAAIFTIGKKMSNLYLNVFKCP